MAAAEPLVGIQISNGGRGLACRSVLYLNSVILLHVNIFVLYQKNIKIIYLLLILLELYITFYLALQVRNAFNRSFRWSVILPETGE